MGEIMKKLISVFILCVLFLTGCRNSVSDHSNEETKKKIRVEVYTAQDDTYVITIDDQNTINQVFDTSNWEEAEEWPADLKPNYTMPVYQEKTPLYGQNPSEERDYELIETLITYQGSSYIQEIISSNVVHNMMIPKDVMTSYYVMPEENQREFDQIINH